jgi:hypothetical protein
MKKEATLRCSSEYGIWYSAVNNLILVVFPDAKSQSGAGALCVHNMSVSIGELLLRCWKIGMLSKC